MSDSNTQDTGSVIRFWGGHRESDWNSYWRMDELMRQRNQLAAALHDLGIQEVDVCPALRLPTPVTLHYFEIFVPKPCSQWDAQVVCDEILRLTGRLAQPMAAETDAAFRTQVKERLLYVRQRFEVWDEVLPRFILGVDFNSGRHVQLSPAEPARWRLVDHMVGGWDADRRVLPTLLLKPSEKGSKLLVDLKAELDDWYQSGVRPSLNAILDYRRILNRYGVDCNESFRYGLADGWFPIDIEKDRDWNAARELCATPLPDNPGDLLLDQDNKPVGKYGAIFSFVALTDNST